MNAKEKTYMMALAALLLIGLSTAWAGYNATATITINDGISEFATVTKKNDITLSDLKKNVWFYETQNRVFDINTTLKTDIKVNVTVSVNMGQCADYFKALDILVELRSGGASGTSVDYGVISLEGGTSSVILGATLKKSANLTVNVEVWGRPTKTATSSITICMYCAVEPAEAVRA
jgi:hypothetical protein